jgi:hypothetical protein
MCVTLPAKPQNTPPNASERADRAPTLSVDVADDD